MEKSSKDNELIKGLSKNVGVAAGELWKIFVKEYLIKGLGELLVAATGFCIAFAIHAGGTGLIYQSAAGAVSIASILYVRSALPLIFNPGYYAIANIATSLKKITSSEKSLSTYDQQNRSSF